ncbi:MAG: hypothetical protein HYV90_04015 [Candidatus Woesebacteria bacterium]|nr:MAG: hypothetical protein HYV90_04015 [Candidatus Woesebacteria bacterium]
MERVKSHESFDPARLADLEIQSIKYEFQDNQKAKFDCGVQSTQLMYGINEVSAYRTMVAKRKIENKELSDDERRNARIEFFQTISTASGLGFDPYEAALADEKLDLAKESEDKKKIIGCLAGVFSILYKKPASVFREPTRLLLKFTDELYEQLAFAMMRSPSFVMGMGSGARSEIEKNMDFDKLQKSSLKRWKSLKQAIES